MANRNQKTVLLSIWVLFSFGLLVGVIFWPVETYNAFVFVLDWLAQTFGT